MAFAPSNLTPVPGPGALRYGLFTVANGPLPLDGHARIAGATYDSLGCGTPRGYRADCIDVTPATKVVDPNNPEQALLPFVVYASLLCGSVGYSADYLEAKIRAKLQAVEQSAVEQALWSGLIAGTTLGNTPTFQNGAAIGAGGNPVILTAAASLKAAVSALEDYATDNYGYVPTIHAPADVTAHMAAAGLIRQVGTGIMTTNMGTKLSFGAYPGTSPAGVAAVAGHAWLYITGQVTLWRENEIFVPPPKEVFNRTLNQYNLLAERTWAATYDCFVAAIDVTL